MNQNNNVFKYIEQLASFVPIPLCWLDVNGVVLGGNKLYLQAIGATSFERIVGRQYSEIYPKSVAEKITENINLVINAKETVETEETINDLTTSKPKYFLTVNSPLYDENNIVVGVITALVDNTKKTQNFRNEIKTIATQEQEKFKKFTDQVAHDLRSPLASLSAFEKTCKGISEDRRVILKDVVTKIDDIANNLSNYDKIEKGEKDITTQEDARKFPHILVSLALSEVVSGVRQRYKNLPVEFNSSFEPGSGFVFIKANLWSFNRMISNLVDNAVDAFEGNKGMVSLNLDLDGERVKVTIQDNGKGMPESVVNRIMNNVTVSSGKQRGNGIGFAQAHATLQACKGKMLIESQPGKGTKLTLVFPRVEAAKWAAEEIDLNKGDIVVILDDDHSVHGSWEMCFKPYKSAAQLRHFELGQDAINFINSLPNEEKGKVFLLADFELINQELDGLQVVEKLALQKRSLLVTGHYANQKIRELAAKTGVKILPKQLVAEVPVKIREVGKAVATKQTDFVIIDDEQTFTDSLATFLRSKSPAIAIDTYYNPKRFLENLSQYKKDIKICLDYDLEHNIDGIELAKQLYKDGYTKLYLLSGKDFNKEDEMLPSYLSVILKSDVNKWNQLIV